MNNNKKYKKALSNIYVSEKSENNILNKTVNKETKTYRLSKLAYGLTISIIFSLFSIGVVYGEEIKSEIKSYFSWITTVFKKDIDEGIYVIPTSRITHKGVEHGGSSDKLQPVDIKENAIINNENDFMVMSIKEVEAMLGVDILISSKAINKEIKYNTHLVKNKIAKVDLLFDSSIDYSDNNKEIEESIKDDIIKEFEKAQNEKKSITQSITFITKHIDENYLEMFNDVMEIEISTPIGYIEVNIPPLFPESFGKETEEDELILQSTKEKIEINGKYYYQYNYMDNYYITSLNKEIYFVYDNGFVRTENTIFNKIVTIFVYDNLLYTFTGNNVTSQEMIEILESLE